MQTNTEYLTSHTGQSNSFMFEVRPFDDSIFASNFLYLVPIVKRVAISLYPDSSMSCSQRTETAECIRCHVTTILKRVDHTVQLATVPLALYAISARNRVRLISPHFSKFLVSSSTRDYAFHSFLQAILAHDNRP